MERITGKGYILFIVYLIILTLTIGCSLNMIYYPARVPEKDEMYMGIGSKLVLYSDYGIVPLSNTIYFRRGLGAGFDIGCEIKGFFIIPDLVEMSVRKVFKINTDLIDGIVLDVGYGRLLGEEIYGSAALTHGNTFIRGMFSRSCYEGFNGSAGNFNLSNTIVVTINHEIIMNKYSIMPYIMYEKSTTYTDYHPPYTLFMSTDNITYNDLTESNAVGAGVSITLNF